MVRAAISPGQSSFFDLDDGDDVHQFVHDVDQVNILDDGDDVDQINALDGDDHQHSGDDDHVDDDHVDDDHVDDVGQDLQLQPVPDVPDKRRNRDGRRKRIANALEHALAPSTIKAYAKQFRRLEEWCRENDELPLPADPEAIADCLIEKAEVDGWRKSTLKGAWAGIADKHRTNGYIEIATHAGIRRTLKGLVNDDKRPQVQARPLRTEEMAQIRGAAWVPRTVGGRRPRKETPAETRKRALLDSAICSTLRDGMLRRSELEELLWGDVQFLQDGLALITIRHAKTDQEGKARHTPDLWGHILGAGICPALQPLRCIVPHRGGGGLLPMPVRPFVGQDLSV